ncbi:MAG: hypothetical protein K6A65_03335 [Succinivibrionaceae bacterium]|nr:hypothetical protein [Succinivibrionaceae bacterium]
MAQNPGFRCEKCGSANTTLTDQLPGKGGGFFAALSRLLAPGRALPRGRKLVVCKDCGHVSLICIL